MMTMPPAAGVRSRDHLAPHRWLSPRLGCMLLLSLLLLGGCAIPQVRAEERLFLPLQVELLDVVTLPKQTFEETPVGGLSALAYDVRREVFYALSDDRGGLAPPRFYTLQLTPDFSDPAAPKIGSVTIQGVTLLRDGEGQPYERDVLDPEGLVLTPRQTLIVSSEGVAATGSPPALNEYDLQTGRLQTAFPIPNRFLPSEPNEDGSPSRGVRDNAGFEALTSSPLASVGRLEPFRIFMATESALAQDFDDDPENPLKNRFLHYLMGPDQATFIAEYAYPLSLEPMGAISNGLTELLAIDSGGHFLALERAYGIRGFEIKLFQLATGGATDISTLPQIADLDNLNLIQKQLLLDFSTLELPVAALDNLEGMALGAPLPDGSASLWIISDDNFSDQQSTQVWLFRLSSQSSS